ncbi:hypothetical protein RRG08_019001 [Elysia crispata]|uniref:Uncharacterized protein n=1 Tax=Elysia crispata TaxID=231223 RepID=A0AAE1A5C2_9GAST|nr:hypothetical protein RRG08_019001 [Elysia crispata]
MSGIDVLIPGATERVWPRGEVVGCKNGPITEPTPRNDINPSIIAASKTAVADQCTCSRFTSLGASAIFVYSNKSSTPGPIYRTGRTSKSSQRAVDVYPSPYTASLPELTQQRLTVPVNLILPALIQTPTPAVYVGALEENCIRVNLLDVRRGGAGMRFFAIWDVRTPCDMWYLQFAPQYKYKIRRVFVLVYEKRGLGLRYLIEFNDTDLVVTVVVLDRIIAGSQQHNCEQDRGPSVVDWDGGPSVVEWPLGCVVTPTWHRPGRL